MRISLLCNYLTRSINSAPTKITCHHYRLLSTTTHNNTEMSASKFTLSQRFQGSEKNVWVEFARLAVENKALNLGQGMPDFPPPDHLCKSLKDVMDEPNASNHQYARSPGLPHLVNTLAKLYGPILHQDLNPMTDIIPSVGAYGSLFTALQALINKGDEVIIIEPFFDCYTYMVTAAQGTPRFVPLKQTNNNKVTSSADWKLDPAELAAAFNEKTKLIILNTPHNPTGKVFDLEELTMIADLCKKHDVVCIADEVYEWLVFGQDKHLKIATIPGMWERTITIGSGGKTFSATGWKLGWAIGPQQLIKLLSIVHTNCTYACPTPIQEAVARALDYEISRLDKSDCYLTALAKETEPKRDKLVDMLTDLGMKVTVPQGGYFLMADYSVLGLQYEDDGTEDAADFKFARWLVKTKKMAAIPPTAFYSSDHACLGENYIRFCFIKKNESIEAAAKIFKEWKASF